MRLTRVAAAATSLLLLGASTTIGSASAASTGVGTSKASTTVLEVALGNAGALLDVQVLTDSAQSTTDTKTASAPEAFSKLTAATVTSGAVPALNTSIPVGEARQPNGAADVNKSIDLSAPTGVTVPADLPTILDGSLTPAHLTSAVDANGARSALTAALTGLDVAGGLLGANAVNNTSGTDTAASAANSTRAATIDTVTVLDLGAVLNGLGLQLTDLTVGQLDALIDALNTTVPGLDVNATLQETVDAVQAEVTTLLAAITSSTGLLTDNTAVQGVVDAVGLGDLIDTATITGATAAELTQATIDALQAGLAELLTNGLAALDGAPLLKLNGVDVSVTTKAADTAANSVAAVTGKIGSVTVGSITLPAIDLVQTADAINAAVAAINSTIGGALSAVEATIGADVVSLEDLVTVEVLKSTKSVTTSGDYTVATAGITGVSASIKPPVDLAALVDAVVAQAGVDSVITANGGTVPTLDTSMVDLNGVLGTDVNALAGGATIEGVKVLGSSEFKVVAAPTTPTGGTLPKTGSSALRLAALGMLLVALGLGLGRWFSMAVPAFVRRRF